MNEERLKLKEERSLEYRVQRTEYNCRADYFIRQREIIRIKLLGAVECLLGGALLGGVSYGRCTPSNIYLRIF